MPGMTLHSLHSITFGAQSDGAWSDAENRLLPNESGEHSDGFFIGTNKLMQLVLGVGGDAKRLPPLFDQRNPSVTRMIEELIETAHAESHPVGICGQAPSDHPDFAKFLVEAYVPTRPILGSSGALVLDLSLIPLAEIALVVMERGPSLGPRAVPPSIFAQVMLVSAVTVLVVPLILRPLLVSPVFTSSS